MPKPIKPGRALQLRLAIMASNRHSEIEPANIETSDLMIAIRGAARDLTMDGADRDAFIRQVAAELGYKRTSQTVAKAIDNALRAASRRRIIATGRGVVYADCRSIHGYSRDILKRELVRAVGRTWRTRDEAIVLTARALGFGRTGKNIKAALKSAITGLLRQGDLERDVGMIRKVG